VVDGDLLEQQLDDRGADGVDLDAAGPVGAVDI